MACIHRCVFAYANDGVNNGWAVAVASEFYHRVAVVVAIALARTHSATAVTVATAENRRSICATAATRRVYHVTV